MRQVYGGNARVDFAQGILGNFSKGEDCRRLVFGENTPYMVQVGRENFFGIAANARRCLFPHNRLAQVFAEADTQDVSGFAAGE